MDFEIFRADLKASLELRDRSKGGRPAFDAVLKFRMLMLQAMHGLSLAQTEYLVADRLSWMRFCGLGPATLCRTRTRSGTSARGRPGRATERLEKGSSKEA